MNIPEMTLTDYFAGQALQGILTSSHWMERHVANLGASGARKAAVHEAYKIAMAMVLEREALLAHAAAKVEA